MARSEYSPPFASVEPSPLDAATAVLQAAAPGYPLAVYHRHVLDLVTGGVCPLTEVEGAAVRAWRRRQDELRASVE
jgi:hypothetical protein